MTRHELIRNGELVDLSRGELARLAREAGIKVPVAMTREAFKRTVGLLDDPLPEGQSIEGRLWDVLMVFRTLASMTPGPGMVFQVDVWNGEGHDRVTLASFIHPDPDDNWKPVVTIGAVDRIEVDSTEAE